MWSTLQEMSRILSAINTEIMIRSGNNIIKLTKERSGKNGNVLNRNIRLGKMRSGAGMLEQ